MPDPTLTRLSHLPWWVRLALGSILTATALRLIVTLLDQEPVRTPPAPGRSPSASPTQTAPRAVPLVGDATLAALPEATTTTVLPAAPVDPDRFASTPGAVVHPTAPLAVFDTPAGTPIARLPVTQLGNDTWLPTIDEQPGWIRVLLPSRPNGATGWVDATRMRVAHSPYQIRINLAERTLRLLRDGQDAGTWSVATGAPDTPTPPGRTFLLASTRDPTRPGAAVTLPLGAHSSILDTFDGGPGTVAIHAWSDPAVFGTAASHGCLRVSDAAIRALLPVPLGTLVVITEH